MSHTPRTILVVAPFMHRPGHYATYPVDLARGFTANGARVTLVHPFPTAAEPGLTSDLETVCLQDGHASFGRIMTFLWPRLIRHPIRLCLAWLILHTRPGSFDLVYWTDLEPDNQQSSWPMGLAAWLGLYRHRTAFTEHYNFSWSRHRWQRLLRLDRVRLRHLELFVHSRQLLDWIRLNMRWQNKGHYLPWGLWPDPASEEDRASCRAALDIPADARVLLVFGMQAIRRKNIDTLAEALRELPLPAPLFVLFVGKRVGHEPHPFDEPALATKANLHVRHEEAFVANERVKLYFAAADAVWAYYGDFQGASGVFAQAIAHARLPICAAASESGELCRSHGIGLPTPTDDVAGVRTVIRRFLSMDRGEQARLEAATQGAAQVMSWTNITRGILDIVFADPSGGSPDTPPDRPRRT